MYNQDYIVVPELSREHQKYLPIVARCVAVVKYLSKSHNVHSIIKTIKLLRREVFEEEKKTIGLKDAKDLIDFIISIESAYKEGLFLSQIKGNELLK